MSDLFDRNGEPIDSMSFVRLFADKDYQRLALDHLHGYEVSTVWLGIDDNFSREGPPLIFETMVFGDGNMTDLDCRRYATEEEAFQGHAEMLLLIEACSPAQSPSQPSNPASQ